MLFKIHPSYFGIKNKMETTTKLTTKYHKLLSDISKIEIFSFDMNKLILCECCNGNI